jgi:L-fuculose-phosphate aldolase
MNQLAQSADDGLEETIRRVLANYFAQPSAETGNVSGKLSEQEALYHSPEGLALRQEMVWNARKLWERQYVDGNGGNLSCRIGEHYVLCTPSMVSKADVTIDDLCLVDLDSKQFCGPFRRTSELLLHLEIYKANPAARAVVHCHPVHATAYAIAGIIPPPDSVPEQEVFVGPVAIAPYDTPGTQAFAETIRPFVERHNSILLENHGVVCWADTITHAEWFVEVLDTYCRTLITAMHLGAPVKRITPQKIQEILDLKKQLGLPDARFTTQPESNAYSYPKPRRAYLEGGNAPRDFEFLVRSLADSVRQRLQGAAGKD